MVNQQPQATNVINIFTTNSPKHYITDQSSIMHAGKQTDIESKRADIKEKVQPKQQSTNKTTAISRQNKQQSHTNQSKTSSAQSETIK